MVKRQQVKGRIGRGDTLVEVVFALGILTVALIGLTVVVMTSVRTGQTARERTVLSDEAQAQMEALRSFRDNHTWAEFRAGAGAAYPGVDTVGGPCTFDSTKQCFHMVAQNTTPGTHEWVPAAGSMPGSVPTSVMEIWADDSAAAVAARPCDYDFVLHYQFQALGGGLDSSNHIQTRLTNLKYTPSAGLAGVCL